MVVPPPSRAAIVKVMAVHGLVLGAAVVGEAVHELELARMRARALTRPDQTEQAAIRSMRAWRAPPVSSSSTGTGPASPTSIQLRNT